MMTDPIADMLTRIRNAAMVHKKEVAVPYSKLKLAIAEILVREGYVTKVEETKTKPAFIMITLKYHGRESAIQHLERLSTPGQRKYVKKDKIERVLNGLGLAILSTPKGILTGAEAIKENVGGELLCEIY
jgi:small subunit ribosomal protein S8